MEWFSKDCCVFARLDSLASRKQPTKTVDSLLQPIAQKQELYIKDTTHFINFIENTPLPDGVVLPTLDVCSLYTNSPQEEGIEVVCQYYQEHYQSKTPIPTQSLGDLMRLILKENSFKFNDKHYLQTHGIAMGTKNGCRSRRHFYGAHWKTATSHQPT